MVLPVVAVCVTAIAEDSDRCVVLKGEKRDIIKADRACIHIVFTLRTKNALLCILMILNDSVYLGVRLEPRCRRANVNSSNLSCC